MYDIDIDGIELISELMQMKENYEFSSQILAASIRHMVHWRQAVLIGADVVTIPPKLMDPIMNHPLTLKGIALFDADWKKLGKKELLG